jgi:PAS domain S-box-containing protein
MVSTRLRQALGGYGIALGAVVVVCGFRLWFESNFEEQLSALLFVIPVVLAAWWGGLGPSIFATALSALLLVWFFIEPRYSLGVADVTGWVKIGTYVISSGVICGFVEALRRPGHRAEIQTAWVKAKHQELLTEMEARKKVEEALAASERQYRAVIEATPNLVWTALPDGTCDYANTQWERYTGVSRTEATGDWWAQFVCPDDRERALAAWGQAVKSGTEATFEVRLRSREGAYRWFKVRAVPLRDGDSDITRWLGTCTDITEFVVAKEQLLKSHDQLEQRVSERTAEIERLKNKLQEENYYLRETVRVTKDHRRIVGQSPALQRVLAQAEQVGPTDATVLLLGETGTGKELLAEAIHESSGRRGKPLVRLNCAAMPAALVESELFGREKGAFTGSLSRQIGRFELADKGTIFLDEIGDLPLEIQTKLLRVLETRQIERLGNPRPIPVDVRIIAATNRDLEQAIREGKFRQDLYYRLNVFPITLPPLRERAEDIPLLVWAFVDEFSRTFNKDVDSIERESMDALQRHSWPGNIRELRNLIERAMIVATSRKLRIRPPVPSAQAPSPGPRRLEEVEREHMLTVLEESGWRVRGVKGAATKLGLKPTTLEARMAKLGIRRPGAGTPAD